MINNKNNLEQWFTSKETKEKLNITDCQLMHIRVDGKLKFKRKGNTYLYLLSYDKTP